MRHLTVRALVVTGLCLTAWAVLAGPAAAAPLHQAHHALTSAASPGQVLAEGLPGPDAELRKEAALAGYLSYGLMAMTVVWGIFLATGWARRIARRNAVYSGHMTLALTAQTFAVMHALSYVLQSQKHFTIAQAFIPFVQGGEPEVALGIIGLELMIGASVAVTLVHKLNYRRFRKVHIIGTYLGALLSWIHVLTTSNEAKSLGLLGLTVGAAAAVCIIFAVLRVLPPSRKDRARFALQPIEASGTASEPVSR